MIRTIAVGLLAVSLMSAAPRLARASASDAWITTKAKMTLLTTEGVGGTGINVDTTEGRVTLHGKVGSNEEKAKAESAVKAIDGVTEVRSLLQVVPASRAAATKHADADVKRAVEQTLARDKALADSKIAVQSVNDGVVLLSGKAETVTDHLRGIQDASRVPGVRRVASEIESPDKLADDEIRHSQHGKKDTPRSVSDSAADLRITAATKLRLIADSNTPALDINVDTRDGVVTLFGIVPTPASKRVAEADARKVSGVTRVANELQVVPSSARETVDAHDDVVKRDVEQAIAARQDLKDVDVEVKNGVVRLSGTVPSEEHRLGAAITARATAGVRAVQDDLRIRNDRADSATGARASR
jgi:hyperosmotically inducible periplasmic protein